MLYLVSTPIGNLADITFRAVDILKDVDLIVSEDSRKTSILLNHYGIKKPQIAYNNFNEKKVYPKVISLLLEGKNIALVTSAGTPGISDPGYLLITAAIQHNIPIFAIPGASACITALTLSGLPMHSFTFRGFPPHKEGPRKRFLQQDSDSTYTLVYYESPYRIKAFLANALEIFGERRAALSNDLTKKFEATHRKTLSALVEQFSQEEPRGEYVIVIEGLTRKKES